METIHTLYEFDVLNVSCFATGGRPPTSFEWSLLGEYYNSSYLDVENISPTDTFNVKSVLSLKVHRSFDKRKLTCRAFDSIANDGITKSQTIEVYCEYNSLSNYWCLRTHILHIPNCKS